MSSPATLALEALLAPVPGDRPGGDWLPDVHAAIEQARRADDTLPRGDWKRETKTADWIGVIGLATEALAGRTKDLKTAAFLVEALVKEHGFAGARDGFRLLRELQTRFWEAIHPQIEDGDLEGRIAPLEWLNSKLPATLKETAVTRSRDGRTYSFHQWEESRAVENLARQRPEARDEAIAEGKVSVEQIDKATAATPRAFYEAVVDDLSAAAEELRTLDAVIDEKFGRDAPGLLDIRKMLEECRHVLEPILKRKRELEPDVASADGPAAHVTARGDAADAAERGPSAPLDPVNRADALRRLNAIAAFFRRTEPQSPVAYLVERAARWGQIPLEQWLQEVIHDESVLARVRETLGLVPVPTGRDASEASSDGTTDPTVR